jgi:cell shape-determining protein MreC
MRRVREWPRLIVAVALLAAVLVLIGVVVASAASSSGGGNTTTNAATSTPLLKAPKSDQGVLKRQVAEITRLRATDAALKGQIATLQQRLKRERALARMQVHAKVKHHKKHHANRR